MTLPSILRLVVVNVLQEWLVLGLVDLEELVERHLHSVQDWEKNFKALKIRGKESESLPRYTLYTKKHNKTTTLPVYSKWKSDVTIWLVEDPDAEHTNQKS